VIAVPCAILLATDLTVAALLTVEWFKTYPVGGSGAGKRRAEKRAAEAADGASNLKGASEADRFHTPVNRVRLSALHPISTGSVVQTTPANKLITVFVSKQVEKCRKALTARVTNRSIGSSSVTASGQCPPVDSFSGAARCLVPDSDQPAS